MAEDKGATDDNRAVEKDIREHMQALHVSDPSSASTPRHTFWETQPVVQFTEGTVAEVDTTTGPIDRPMTVSEVKQEPYNLPPSFEWTTVDMNDADTVQEVYKLLNMNYVEDDDNMFRFDYSMEFLKWALQPPEYKKEWHVGVRVSGTGKLVAFITGIPAVIRVKDQEILMAEINFLCIHKKLRSKRLAPVLIKEVTRRVNLCDIWQASYTAGIVLPKPVATCRYYHRSLNPKKLIEVGFSSLHPRMTMSRTIKFYKLPNKPVTPGFRQMSEADVPAVTKLLKAHLAQFGLAPVMSEADIRHWLLPRENVVDSYVVEENPSEGITDFVSFYTLPSTIVGNEVYNTLKAAYCYYLVPNKTSALTLMNDALIVAKNSDFDVFNALDVMHNMEFLKELKFGKGDGDLQYYLYNYRVPEMKPSGIGLVLL
eukprot:gene19533-23360_t